MRFLKLQRLAVVLLAGLTGLGLSLLPGSMTASAQGIITGGITGSVVDQTGAVIPGASITAVNESTGTTLAATSNGEGVFLISDVPLGSYTISIRANGFGQGQVSHVHVVAGNQTQLGKQALKLGNEAQTVEVEAGAAQVMNTESAQGELIVDTTQLQSMPVDGAMDNVTLMVPGVVATHSDGMSNTNGVNFSVNGERGRSNNSEIDGQSNNDNMVAGPSFFFSNQDAVQELQIITNDFGAQYGRNMGSVVNYITKSGTNSFHGSAFEMYTGSFLSSLLGSQKDPQDGFCSPGISPSTGCAIPVVPRFVDNNYGGTFGGPILKDKLFFFGSTFWTHEYQAGATETSGGALLPDATGMATLQASFPNNPGTEELAAFGPASVPQGNPTFFGTPSTIAVTDGTTTANVEVNQFQRKLASAILDQEELGRLDYQMTSKDRFYLRYNYQNNPFLPAYYLYGSEAIAAGGYSNVTGITHQVGGDWTHTFTPSIVNQLRYGFQQSNIAFEGGTIPGCTISSFGPCSSTVSMGASAGITLGTIGYGSAFPQGRFIKVNQIQDNASWSHGKHTIVWGGEFDHQDSPAAGLPAAEGAFNTNPADTGVAVRIPGSVPAGQAAAYSNGLSSLLEGISFTSLSQGKTSTPFKEPDFALYVQDNWKMIPNLTLNLGVRYEFFGQSVNLLHTESVAQQTGSDPFWSTSLPLSATTFPHINPSYRNVEPRIGLAYTPGFSRKMVVHAGFAINVDPAFYNIFLNSAQSAPLVNSGSFTCDGVTVQCVPGGGLTFANVQAADVKFIPTGGDPRVNPLTLVPTNFRNPMAETYTLGVQYQLFPSAVMEVRYVGNHTFDQFQSLNTNPDILDVQSAFPAYGGSSAVCTTPTATGYTRPNCNYFLTNTVANTAFSIYNGLQTSFTLHDFHHWTGTASYTYSRAIDNVSELFSTASGGTTNAYAQDPLNTDIGERGVSGNSYPSVWGIQAAYNEPWFSSQHGIVGRALGGYFFNAFYQYNGGQPFNPFQAEASGNPFLPNPSDPLATTSFCDASFDLQYDFGGYVSQCRPILANKSAPMTSVGINTGGGNYINYATGVPGARSSFHWLWNNQYEAMALNNPFPGVGRNTLRGDSFNNLDLTVGKNIHLTERVNMLLELSAFNALNRAYYGTPDANIEDSYYPSEGLFPSFLLNTYENGSAGSSAGGGAFFQGAGNRNIQLIGKITF
jgi:Carboxypeptidase regulatory-like domain/TonB dependent receptor